MPSLADVKQQGHKRRLLTLFATPKNFATFCTKFKHPQ